MKMKTSLRKIIVLGGFLLAFVSGYILGKDENCSTQDGPYSNKHIKMSCSNITEADSFNKSDDARPLALLKSYVSSLNNQEVNGTGEVNGIVPSKIIKLDTCVSIIDIAQVNHIIDNLISDETCLSKKIKYIDILAEIGTPEVQKTIRAMIDDPSEDAELRAAAIKATKWDKNPDDLLSLFQETADTEILVATIEAANATEYDSETITRFDDVFFDAYHRINNAEMRIAILNYFETKPHMINQLIAQNIPELSVGVLKHIDELQYDISDSEHEYQ